MNDAQRIYHERKIKYAVGWFFAGCIVFVLLEVILIYIGAITLTHPEYDWSGSYIVMGLGGLYLLWKMTVAMFFKTPLPDSYHRMNFTKYNEVLQIIDEITTALDLSVPQGIYVAPGVNVAVFCRPTILSMLRKPKRELVIGEVLLETLSKDELRVILYHEFGHYVSGSLGKKTPIYVISQFSKSFTSIKNMRKPGGVWSNMINSQVDLFSYFAFWLCSIIDRHYKYLSQGEELSADDVAVENMNAEILAQTLVKVSLLRYYSQYIQWVSVNYKIKFRCSDIPSLLIGLCRNHHYGVKSMATSVRNRIERLELGNIQSKGYHDFHSNYNERIEILPILTRVASSMRLLL